MSVYLHNQAAGAALEAAADAGQGVELRADQVQGEVAWNSSGPI